MLLRPDILASAIDENTKKGEKKAQKLQKAYDKSKTHQKAQGKMNQMFGAGDESSQPIVKGWENERNYVDIYYNASKRGPLGLY